MSDELADGIRRTFANRYFIAFLLAFFALWGAAVVLSKQLSLSAGWTVFLGIVVSDVANAIGGSLQEMYEERRKRKELVAWEGDG